MSSMTCRKSQVQKQMLGFSPFTDRVNNLRSAQHHTPKQHRSLSRHFSIPAKENQPQLPRPNPKLEHFQPLVRPSEQSIKTQLQSTKANLESAYDYEDSLESIGGSETSKVFSLIGQFSTVREIFMEEAHNRKMSVVQTTDYSVTIRKGSFNSCNCFFKLWSPRNRQGAVYQLRSTGKGTRAKVIMVEGAQTDFKEFCMKFMKTIQKQHLAKLTKSDLIELFFSQHVDLFDKVKKDITKLCSKKQNDKAKEQAEALLMRVKSICLSLQNKLCQQSQIMYNSSNAVLLEKLCYKETGISVLFEQLYHKDTQQYQKNRENILRKYTLSNIFNFLQITEHFDNFRRRRRFLQGYAGPMGDLPYLPALRCLQSIEGGESPGVVLQKVLLFQQKINFCYEEYFANKMRLGGMDDYLPLSIFSVLATDCSHNKLLAAVKMLQAWMSEQDEFECERKILTNLQAGFEYISREWTN